ncbi:holin [Pseudomonas phage vB_Pae10145-KEN51]|nr:hypothetical protein [Pseudomonas phage PhiPizzaParty]BDR24862.1 hypothetical protein RVBP14_0280 [Pseudomonas phage sp. Brmt]
MGTREVININHDLPIWILLLLSTATSFIYAFVKTFQQRNIFHGYKKAAFFTSWGISTLELTTIGLFVIVGLPAIISSGLGGSIGVVLAMTFHDKIFRKTTE